MAETAAGRVIAKFGGQSSLARALWTETEHGVAFGRRRAPCRPSGTQRSFTPLLSKASPWRPAIS